MLFSEPVQLPPSLTRSPREFYTPDEFIEWYCDMTNQLCEASAPPNVILAFAEQYIPVYDDRPDLADVATNALADLWWSVR